MTSSSLTLESCMSGELTLSCGYVDKDGVVHDKAGLREMTGEEEDILAQRHMGMGQKLTQIIGNCLTKIGPVTDKAELRRIAGELTIGDRIVLLLALRVLSLGPTYSFQITCPECKTKQNHGLRLDKLAIKEMPDKRLRELQVTLPSGKKVGLKVMTAQDEQKLEKHRGQKDSLSLGILARLTMIGENTRPTLKDVKGFSWRDRHLLRDKFMKLEGGVDTDIQVVCDNCDHEFQSVLDVGQPSFFFPSESETTEESQAS